MRTAWAGSLLALLSLVGVAGCDGSGAGPPKPPVASETDEESGDLVGTWKTPGYDYRIIFAASGDADVWNQDQWCGRFRFEVVDTRLKFVRAATQPDIPLGTEPAVQSLCRSPEGESTFAIEGKELKLGDSMRLWRESAEAPLVP
jgi:hypothetical protein